MRKPAARTCCISMGMSTLVLLALGIGSRQRWSWLVIPTWITAVATLGLLVSCAVIAAVYAQKTFASQAEELREQRAFDSRQVEFNDKQFEICRTSASLPREQIGASGCLDSGPKS